MRWEERNLPHAIAAADSADRSKVQQVVPARRWARDCGGSNPDPSERATVVNNQVVGLRIGKRDAYDVAMRREPRNCDSNAGIALASRVGSPDDGGNLGGWASAAVGRTHVRSLTAVRLASSACRGNCIRTKPTVGRAHARQAGSQVPFEKNSDVLHPQAVLSGDNRLLCTSGHVSLSHCDSQLGQGKVGGVIGKRPRGDIQPVLARMGES
jgi:hypothetical protein